MAPSPQKISDIFKAIGQPTVTYVQRASGALEKRLGRAMDERGQLCLVTGPSKTGKTTLYREVLSERGEVPLLVQCDRQKTSSQIWTQILEAVDFERAEHRTSTATTKAEAQAEVSGKLGWKWLAEASSRIKGTLGRDTSEAEARVRVLAEPGPDLLIPLLKLTNYVLVIEDFHYLDDNEKVLLFQQWKRFIDNEVSVLVLGTTHRAVDIANSNRDLVGRITQIDVKHWDTVDLAAICERGFSFVGTPITRSFTDILAAEAVGLPIIVQQTCLQLFTSKDVSTVRQAKKSPPTFNHRDIQNSLHEVARYKYTQFESYYNTLIRGPREKARKYRTYELVLACFTQDPIKFALNRSEIDARMSKLKIAASELPPTASVNSTLGALKKFQERRNFQLLEWRPNEEVLYIVEPSFLFYVRWRTKRTPEAMQLDLFEELIKSVWGFSSEMRTVETAWQKFLKRFD